MQHKDQIKQIIATADKFVIIQADNPDADSLGSALAMEQILADLNKDTFMYCAVEMPSYLKYMEGWDRVNNYLPSQLDASIIVDASTMTLLERLDKDPAKQHLLTKPCLVLDHHEVVDNPVTFATVILNRFDLSSTGELVYSLAKELDWPLNLAALSTIMHAILGDTQGLTNQLASSQTYRVVADIIDSGIDRSLLEEERRKYAKMPLEIYKYKADLIKRTEFVLDNKLAIIDIPQDEINKFSPLYNPGPLIQGDMLQTEGVAISVVVKRYEDGKLTGSIRANPNTPIAADLAQIFNGGGHKYASGFKINDGLGYDDLKEKLISSAAQLINNLELN